jgi:hypothetical protein
VLAIPVVGRDLATETLPLHRRVQTFVVRPLAVVKFNANSEERHRFSPSVLELVRAGSRQLAIGSAWCHSERCHRPNVPLFAPRVFAKCLLARRMDGWGGGDRIVN